MSNHTHCDVPGCDQHVTSSGTHDWWELTAPDGTRYDLCPRHAQPAVAWLEPGMTEPIVAMGDDYTTDDARLLATSVDLLSRILAVLREQRVILQGLADRE